MIIYFLNSLKLNIFLPITEVTIVDYLFLIRPISSFIFDYGLIMGLIVGMSLGTILDPILDLILCSILVWIQLFFLVTPISRADAGNHFLEFNKLKTYFTLLQCL